MSEEFMCQKIHHPKRKIMGFCLNLNCRDGTPQYCPLCLQKDHTDCDNKCFEFSLMVDVFDKVVEFLEQMQHEAQMKFDEAKNKFDKVTKELVNMIESFSKFKINIKNQEYFPIKNQIKKIKWWYNEAQKEKKFSNFNYGLQLLQKKNWKEAVKQLNLDQKDENYELAQFYKAWGLSQQNILLNDHPYVESLGGLNPNLISKLQNCVNDLLTQDQKNWVALVTKGILLSNKREFNSSLLQFNQVLKNDNQNIYSLYWKCHALINLKNLDEAQEIIIQMSKIDPNYILRFVAEGYLLYQQEQFDEALKCYKSVLEKNPNYVSVLMYSGFALSKNGQDEQAEQIFSKVIQIDQNNYIAYFYLGVILENQDKIEEAISCYDCAISINQKFHEAYLKKSQALKALKNYKEAEKTLNDLIDMDLNYAKAYFQKGLLLQTLTKYNEAIAHYSQATQLGFQDPELFYNNGLCLFQLNKFSEALQSFKVTSQLNKNNSMAHLYAGQCLVAIYKLKDALQEFGVAKKMDPNIQNIDFIIGLTYFGQLDYNKAIESFYEAIQKNYSHLDSHFYLGLTLLKQQKYQDAIIYFDVVISANKIHVKSYIYKGHALRKQMQYQEALKCYEDAELKKIHNTLSIIPQQQQQQKQFNTVYGEDEVLFIKLFLKKGQVLYQQGEYQKALESFSQISKIDSKYVNAYNYSGLTLCKMKKIDEGLKQFEQAIAIKPQFPLSYFLRDYFNNTGEGFKPNQTVEKLMAIFPVQPKTQLLRQQIQLLLETIGSQEQINYQNETYLEEIIKISKKLQKIL